MTEAHFKCVDGLGIQVLKHPVYTSRAWDISKEDAQNLVGGKIHFHNSKSETSYFGGVVKGFEIVHTDSPHDERVVFTVESHSDCKNVAWAGIDHINAHYSGVLEV